MGNSKAGFALVALVALAAKSSAVARADSADFKFPLLLCIYQYSMVDEKDGYLQPVAKSSEIQVFPVQNIREFSVPAGDGSSTVRQEMTGEAQGEYSIENSPYRFTFDAKIVQGLADGRTDELKLESRLERKSGDGGQYEWVGQRTNRQMAAEGDDGFVWKDVYGRAENSLPEMDEYKGRDGKGRRFDLSKVEAGITDRKLPRGTVFQAGPVCSLMDLETVRQMSFNQTRYADIFKRAETRKALLARIEESRQERPAAQAPAPVDPDPPAALQAQGAPASPAPEIAADASVDPEPPPGTVLPPVAMQGAGDPAGPQDAGAPPPPSQPQAGGF